MCSWQFKVRVDFFSRIKKPRKGFFNDDDEPKVWLG
jgi:hypothetical protein